MTALLRSMMVLGLLVLTAPVHAQFVTFDDFNGSVLSAKRWVPGSVGPLGAVEYRRYVAGGELHMGLYGIGGRQTTTGQRVRLRNRVYMHPNLTTGLKTFQMRARVDSTKVRGCADPASDVTRARLFMDLLWFNDGRSTEPGDFTGDVFGTLEMRKSAEADFATSGLSVVGRMFRCEDVACGDYRQLGDSMFLGEVKRGETVDLASNWDRSNGLVKWRAKVSGRPVMAADFDYLSFAPKTVPSHNRDYVASIHLRTEIADCDVAGSGSRTPFSTMNAAISRVRIKRE